MREGPNMKIIGLDHIGIQVAEVAKIMLVFASEEGRCLNGQALNIDGGMEMH